MVSSASNVETIKLCSMFSISYVDCLRSCKTFDDLSKTFHHQASQLGDQKSLLVIDNLTLLLRRFGVDRIAALLFEIGCQFLSDSV